MARTRQIFDFHARQGRARPAQAGGREISAISSPAFVHLVRLVAILIRGMRVQCHFQDIRTTMKAAITRKCWSIGQSG